MAITLRTIVIADGTAYVQSGAGVVADSTPAREFEETLEKAGAMFAAIHQAEGGIPPLDDGRAEPFPDGYPPQAEGLP